MKRIKVCIFALACCSPAFGWNCTGNNIRVQVPTGTLGTGPGDAPGNVVVDNGLTFECEPPIPTTSTPPPTTPTSTSNATSASNSAANSTSNSSATGGKATSTATGGNASVGPITNTLANTNNLSNSQNQKQGQTQSQSNASTNNNQSTGGSVSDVGNSSTVVQRSAPMAYAPTIFPSGCNGSISGGASAPLGGISLGGTKQDHHCQQMQTAAMFLSQGNLEAATLILCRTWAARDAKLTLDQCRLIAKAQSPVPVVSTVVPVVSTPAPVKVEIINNIPPAPTPIIIHESIDVIGPKLPPLHAKKRIVHRPCPVTPLQNECPITREK